MQHSPQLDSFGRKEGRVGELRRHQAAKGKQRELQPHQEQRQAHQHVNEADQYPPQVRDRSFEHQKLKADDYRGDGNDVADGRQNRSRNLCHQIAHVSIPYASTKMIGVKDAKAMSPNPSVIGLRPRIEDASPTPRAVTMGTVIVEVVTPPES